MKVREIDHICFAVRSLDQARTVYENVLGLEPARQYKVPQESIKVVRYWVGSVAVELIEPMTPDCEVARFLETRGEGFYLISYRVDNVEQALNELRDAGHHTIDKSPRTLMGTRYAFINRPREMHGVLTEIIDGEFVPSNRTQVRRLS